MKLVYDNGAFSFDRCLPIFTPAVFLVQVSHKKKTVQFFMFMPLGESKNVNLVRVKKKDTHFLIFLQLSQIVKISPNFINVMNCCLIF